MVDFAKLCVPTDSKLQLDVEKALGITLPECSDIQTMGDGGIIARADYSDSSEFVRVSGDGKVTSSKSCSERARNRHISSDGFALQKGKGCRDITKKPMGSIA